MRRRMRRFLRNNMLILVLLNSSNIFNYLFQLTAGRGLTTIDYGSFNAVNSMAVILSAPIAVLPLVFSRYTVQLAESGAVVNIIFTYCLARSEFKFLWPLAFGVGMMLLLIFNFHDSALTIGMILAGTLAWYFLSSRRPLPSS